MTLGSCMKGRKPHRAERATSEGEGLVFEPNVVAGTSLLAMISWTSLEVMSMPRRMQS